MWCTPGAHVQAHCSFHRSSRSARWRRYCDMNWIDVKVLPYTQNQLRFCQALPKIELHAHLNGSIRDSTIRYVTPHLPCSLPPSLHTTTTKFNRASLLLAENWLKVKASVQKLLHSCQSQVCTGQVLPVCVIRSDITFDLVCRHPVSARGIQTLCCDTHSHNHSCCYY